MLFFAELKFRDSKKSWGSFGKKYNLNDEINIAQWPNTWEDGITHMDREKKLWSGNIKGFIQHRNTIPGENYTGEI